MDSIYAFCRPGFEVEAGRELVDAGIAAGVYGHFLPLTRQGLVELRLPSTRERDRLMAEVPLSELVFSRDWLAGIGEVELPREDRVQAILSLLDANPGLPLPGELEIQVVEGNQDPDLHRFARKWTPPLARALRESGRMAGRDPRGDRLDIVLMEFDRARVGLSRADNRSPFAAGRPRLRLSPKAPSRSALKLEEAWHLFIGPDHWYEVLGGGKRAVDLGAAPGGWTWQLVNQGMTVSAVDNGPMEARLMASGQVEHIRADGYNWLPKRPVDWMVCDIVDKPRRTAGLMGLWLSHRLCRFTVFNLKLPMKNRYDEWLACRELLLSTPREAGVEVCLRARQLYHDREEVTCFVERLS